MSVRGARRMIGWDAEPQAVAEIVRGRGAGMKMSDTGEALGGDSRPRHSESRVRRDAADETRREDNVVNLIELEGGRSRRALVGAAAFLDELRDAYVATDEAGRVVDANPAAVDLLAVDDEGLGGMLLGDLVGAAGTAVVAEGLEAPGLGVRPLPSLRLGFTILAVRVSHDVQHGMVHWLFRPEAGERAERPEDQPQAALIDQMPAVGYVCDRDDLWTCRYVTPQVASLLGYTPRTLYEDPDLWLDCIHADDRERVVTERIRATTTGAPYSSEYRLQHVDGHYLHVLDQAVAAYVGVTDVMVGTLVDMTARRQSHEVVNRRRDSLRREVQRLRLSEDARDGFIQLFVHDVRSALTGAKGLAQTLRSGRVEGPAADDLLDRVLANLEQIQQLTDEVLDFSRLQRDGVTVRPVEVEACELVRVSLEQADLLERVTYLQSGPVRATVDPMITRRVVTNLVANAARHCDPVVPIRVRLLNADEGLLVVVEDEGEGVPDEFKERVFEPFVRIGHFERQGLGLGLALVRRLVGWHGGRAWVEDTPGGGAAFHVLLPPAAAQG